MLNKGADCRGSSTAKKLISRRHFIGERILPHHPDSEKFRELVVDTTV
jgi:hypothetical protein